MIQPLPHNRKSLETNQQVWVINHKIKPNLQRDAVNQTLQKLIGQFQKWCAIIDEQLQRTAVESAI